MLLAIECCVFCMIFAVIIMLTQYKNPVKYIMSYPPEIRKRVELLPEYKNSIKKTEKKHIIMKLIAVLVFIILLSTVAYFSGANTFKTAFLHVFILFFSVNLFDLIVLDIGVFCHSKKLRLPGTEDMDNEYKNYLFHIKGALKGIVLGILISLLSASIIYLFSIIKS